MTTLRRAGAVLRKDLWIELRGRQAISSTTLFAVVALLVLAFAMGPDPAAIELAAPGLIWTALTFAAVLGISRVFDCERGNRGMEGLFLYPGDGRAIYLGKLAALATILTCSELLILVLAGLLYNLPLWSVFLELTCVAALGSLGISGIGTLYGALTLNVKAREILLPLLILPLLVPVILASVAATRLLLVGDPFEALGGWVRLLIAFSIVFTVAPLLAFERVLSE